MAFTFKHGDQPLEGYTIQRGVGRGGFGEVYYAVSEGGKEVALKYLRDNPTVELRGVSHCINLKSPHLVTIFDVKPNAEGEYFIIMEYVSGPSLRDLLIAEPEGLGVQKAAFFTREIGKGLSYLHDRGIVHRDLKPGNIFYEDGYVKIGDYGLAKAISVSRHSGQTASVGTVHYMAPEVGTGNYHRGIDIYALGVMLYEMLLGRVPFEGSTMGEVLMKHLTQQPEVDALQAPFASVIRKALAKDPNDRYQTIDEMISEMFTESEIEKSVASFRPESIRQVARHAMETQVGDSPVHSPARAPYAPPPPPRRQDAFARSADMARNAAQVAVDFARQQREQRHPHGAPVGGAMPADMQQAGPTSFWGRALVAMLVVGGLLGLAAGLLAEDAEFVAPAFGFVMALSLGATIGYRVLNRMPTPEHPGWASRLVTLGCSAAPIALVGAFTTAMGFPSRMALAALAMSLLVDWTKRVHHGQQGRLVKGEAITAGIWGLAITSALTHGHRHLVLTMGGVGAATSLALQLGCWLFRRHGERPSSASAGGSDWTYLEQRFDAPAQRGHMLRIAQYFESLGYSVEEKSRRGLKAKRGSKSATIWAGDIRTYKTELWVRAEDIGGHQLQYTCRYKIWTDRITLGDDQVHVLDGEVSQLARRMNGSAVETAFAQRPRGGSPAFSPPLDPGARARAAVINTPFDGRPSVAHSSPNWPPPPPAHRAASPPEPRLRSTIGRVFWSFATAAFLAGGVGMIAMAISFIDGSDDQSKAMIRELALSVAPKDVKERDVLVRHYGPTSVTVSESNGKFDFNVPRDFQNQNAWAVEDASNRWLANRFRKLTNEDSLELAIIRAQREFREANGYSEDTAGVLAGGLGSLAMAIFCFFKTTRYKRIGFWRETAKPFLLSLCLAGIGVCGSVAGTLPVNDVPKAAFAIPIVFCSISFLLLLFIRGRSEPVAEGLFVD